MAAPGWIELFVTRLEATGIPYMVTGSVASMIYGEPRLTLDLDLVIELAADRAIDLLAVFPESEFYRPPLEVVRAECSREYSGALQRDPPRDRCEGRPLCRCARRAAPMGPRASPEDGIRNGRDRAGTPEYVILRKLEFFREGRSEKHLRDIRGMLATALALDHAFLDAEVRQRGLRRANGSSPTDEGH